jgi:hypothetical protein
MKKISIQPYGIKGYKQEEAINSFAFGSETTQIKPLLTQTNFATNLKFLLPPKLKQKSSFYSLRKIIAFSMVLLFFGLATACEDSFIIKTDSRPFLVDTIDYDNIERLYEQPLEVIKKAVYGKWQMGSGSSKSVVYILRDEIIVDGPNNEIGDLLGVTRPVFYNWEKISRGMQNSDFGYFGFEVYALSASMVDTPSEPRGLIPLRIRNGVLELARSENVGQVADTLNYALPRFHFRLSRRSFDDGFLALDTTDYSNIPDISKVNLYQAQKAVIGKWRAVDAMTGYGFTHSHFINSIVIITKDSIIVMGTGEENNNPNLLFGSGGHTSKVAYHWDYWGNRYVMRTTYLDTIKGVEQLMSARTLWPNSIKGDTLLLRYTGIPPSPEPNYYLLRTKN